MNIELIAAGRTIRVADCHGTPEECADITLGLWQQTEPEEPENLGSGFGFTTEKNTPIDETSYLGYGERPLIK